MNDRFLARAKKNDRLAAWLINIGGFFVIFSVIGILVLILKVAIPLFLPSGATVVSTASLSNGIPSSRVLAVGADDDLTTGYLLDESGTISFFDTKSGRITETAAVTPPGGAKTAISSVSEAPGRHYDILWKDGSFTALKVAYSLKDDGAGSKKETHEIVTIVQEKARKEAPLLSLARTPDGKDPLRVDLLPGNRFSLTATTRTESLDGTESVKTVNSAFGGDIPGTVTAVALDGKAEFLYAGTDRGRLLRWDLTDRESPKLVDTVTANSSGRPVTALSLVFGDVSLAVGDADGTYSTWFPASESGLSGGKTLTRIHALDPRHGAVRTILPSPRGKTLYSLDEKGTVSIDHMTSERHLLSLNGLSPIARFAVSGKEKGVLALDRDNRVTVWRVSIPHPEVSLTTLFGKVWYEGYDRPAHVWQSSSANDDFEPKLSLTPLIFGTLKGTLYAMIFAIPLALLAALYTSQFMGARLKKFVKPAIEIMAAIPSVVIGFLAGLWLAPFLDRAIVPLLVSLVAVPAAVPLSILLWKRIGTAPYLKRISLGYEFLFLIPALVLGVYVSSLVGGMLEASLFGGDFKLWLFDALGVRFDQRNSIIIAFALGLAVVPIIFTIAEDALSNVPKNLAAASLAIGASRWQTAWRVVLPSALPGIFSAVMIGFGRAVGETMIILMATGNTPIMDWSIFNGFRSLSANIAVEIPEAPVFGTLYRVLFFSASLLFLFTFFINTAAEVLRQKFRKKYGRF
jgi:phosphate transport system permease protein